MRKLDDIIPPSRRPAAAKTTGKVPPAPVEPPSTLRLAPRRPRFPMATIIVAVVIIVAAIGGIFYFSGAKVQITPASVSTAVQGSFTAAQSGTDLPFAVISAKKVATQSVDGSGTKTVQSNASGTITVYNTQSKVQKLVANTRFATTAGLIFKIHTAITVPAGSASSPGSVQATVFADQPGASYNVDPTSFTLPGLAGSAQASQVYAKSSASMTGGASGEVPVVDTATANAAATALINALAPDLATALQAQVPDGYVLLSGSATTTYTQLTPAASATTGKVDVKEQGTMFGVIFPKTALAKAIASSVTGLGYQGEPITLASTDGLTVALPGVPDPDATSLTFGLSGTANLVYVVDSSRIASSVAGKSRSAAEVALSNYPEIKRAVLILRPFWRSTFPEDPASISVSIGAP